MISWDWDPITEVVEALVDAELRSALSYLEAADRWAAMTAELKALAASLEKD